MRLTRTRYSKVTWDLEAKDLGKLAWGCALDDFTRCRAMQAFCRQRAKMEHEDEMFWEAEAEVWAQRAAQLDLRINPGVAGQLQHMGFQSPDRDQRLRSPDH